MFADNIEPYKMYEAVHKDELKHMVYTAEVRGVCWSDWEAWCTPHVCLAPAPGSGWLHSAA